MKRLILTVLLTVVQASPPIPRQAPNSSAGTPTKIEKAHDKNDGPSGSLSPTAKPSDSSPDRVPRNSPREKNTERSISITNLPAVSVHRDWADWALWILNGILAGTAVFGICVAYRTLKKIGEQTDATKIAAQAARDNIELFIKKERARLVVDFKPLKLDAKAVPGRSARLVEFTVSISGATAATVLGSGITSGIVVKQQKDYPDLGSAVTSPMTGLSQLIRPNTPNLELETFLFIDETNESMILDAIQKEELAAYVRGFIRYQDVFDEVRIIRFRYYWGPSYPILGLAWSDTRHGEWIKCGPSEDNQENAD